MILVTVLTLGLHAQGGRPLLEETPYAQVKTEIAKGKPLFMEIGSDTCRSCRVMGKLLYAVSKEHPDYLIRFVNVKKEREVAQGYKIMMIPTQIILDKNGKEVYRHVGILEEDVLMKLFDTYGFDVK